MGSESSNEWLKQSVLLLKKKKVNFNDRIARYEGEHSKEADLIKIVKEFEHDLLFLYIMVLVTTDWLKEVETKSENREENMELINALLSSLFEKSEKHEDILKRVIEYFRDVEERR